MKKIISVIIPVLHEQEIISHTLKALSVLPLYHLVEVIVVDGDPEGGTLKAIVDPSVIKILGPRGRGAQMNEGARHGKGELLLFLHGDTVLPNTAFEDILRIRNKVNVACSAFDLAISARGSAFRIIEKTASLRSRITGIPYGDQAFCIKRNWFALAGGFKLYPVMEDVELIRNLKRKGGKLLIFSSTVQTSARRWKREGLVFCTLRNWMILVLYFLGMNPDKLKRFYYTF